MQFDIEEGDGIRHGRPGLTMFSGYSSIILGQVTEPRIFTQHLFVCYFLRTITQAKWSRRHSVDLRWRYWKHVVLRIFMITLFFGFTCAGLIYFIKAKKEYDDDVAGSK